MLFDSKLKKRVCLSCCLAIEEKITCLEQDSILYIRVYLSNIFYLSTGDDYCLLSTVPLTGTQVLQWPLSPISEILKIQAGAADEMHQAFKSSGHHQLHLSWCLNNRGEAAAPPCGPSVSPPEKGITFFFLAKYCQDIIQGERKQNTVFTPQSIIHAEKHVMLY